VSTPAEIWDRVYAAGTDWGQSNPSDLVYRISRRLRPNSRVLDLGCGTGRNALLLAQLGFQVDAVDVSQRALDQLNSSARNLGITRLKAEQGDLTHIQINGQYDLVLLYGVLNSFSLSAWSALLNRARDAVTSAGFICVVYFTSESSSNSIDGEEVVDLEAPGALLDQFCGWSNVSRDSRVEVHVHGGRAMHMHHIERLVFQKAPPPDSNQKLPRVVSVVGPTSIEKAAISGMRPASLYLEASRSIGREIAKSGAILQCIPDGGVGLTAFESYSASSPHRPAKVFAPIDDLSRSSRNPSSWLRDLRYPADIAADLTWEQQAPQMLQSTDVLVALGLSAGTLIEVMWAKWIRRPVYVSLDLCGRLPTDVRGEVELLEFPTFEGLLKDLFPLRALDGS